MKTVFQIQKPDDMQATIVLTATVGEFRELRTQLSGKWPSAEFSRSIGDRSEEQTSELQSLMRISYAGFCLKKKKTPKTVALHTIKNKVHQSTINVQSEVKVTRLNTNTSTTH